MNVCNHGERRVRKALQEPTPALSDAQKKTILKRVRGFVAAYQDLGDDTILTYLAPFPDGDPEGELRFADLKALLAMMEEPK